VVALAILGGVFALALGVGYVRSRRLSFPAAYEVRPAPLEGLPPAQAARVDAWGAALEGLGYARLGDFRSEIDLLPGGRAVQVQQKRLWASADRRTWASAKRVSILMSGGQGAVRDWLALAFFSRLPSGAWITTHNSSALESRFLRDPEGSERIWPGIEDVALLHEAHARHLRERKASPVELDGDVAASERAGWSRATALAEAGGFLERRDDRWCATARLAWRSTLNGFNPLRAEEGRPAAVAGRLLAISAATAAAVALLLEGGAPPWGVAIPFSAAAAAACLAFPKVALYAWIYAMLPAHAVLLLADGPMVWPWMLGGAVLVLLLGPLERRRYLRATRALSRPEDVPPPLTPRMKAVGTVAVLGSLATGVALLVWARSPKALTAGAVLAVAVVSVGLAGLLVLDVVSGLFPSLRGTPTRRILRGIGTCAMLILLGLLAGAWLASQDEKASAAAARRVVDALKRHRAERGSYPASLAELGDLPTPRCGWKPQSFGYIGPAHLGPDQYQLIWPTARGAAWTAPDVPTP
jgi:hypothetical protein